MSIIKNKNFDYQTYMSENSPETASIQRGTKARKQRSEAAIKKFTVRIDKELFDQFQHLVMPQYNCEKLINQALREWLSAKSVKELLRSELQQVVRKTFSSFQSETGSMKIADKESSYNKR
ncbi:hypothetical protein H8E88_06135 [candidate division KSB1 bacterium]|nr:hypothetical protein [candidate division KSB1 bacterium]